MNRTNHFFELCVTHGISRVIAEMAKEVRNYVSSNGSPYKGEGGVLFIGKPLEDENREGKEGVGLKVDVIISLISNSEAALRSPSAFSRY